VYSPIIITGKTMIKKDIRWKQRFQNYQKTFAQFESAVKGPIGSGSFDSTF
jgi:hypothetical protein